MEAALGDAGRTAGPMGGRLEWPSAPWSLILGILILLQAATHLGIRSPYLYYTQGWFQLVDGTYGLRLGPAGELVHADAPNYWPVEFLFSGKYRGDHLSTLSRPAYPFLASLLDNYLHPVYAGWLINAAAWWAAALAAFALARGLGLGLPASRLSSFLVAASPAFISMAGQPMGYSLGYGLHVLFLACLAGWLPSERPRSAAAALLFLLVLADLTYEILGFLCLVPFLARAWTGLGRGLAAACAAGMIGAKLAWDAVVVRLLFDRGSGSALDARMHDLAAGQAFSWSTPALVAGHLAWGTLIGGFFLVPLLGWAGLAAVPAALRRFCLAGMAAVALPLFYMGLVGETSGGYAFYKEGRVVAYFYPFLVLAAAGGMEALAARLKLSGRAYAALLIAVGAAHLLLADSDLAGFRALYHLFHHRPGYAIDEILAP